MSLFVSLLPTSQVLTTPLVRTPHSAFLGHVAIGTKHLEPRRVAMLFQPEINITTTPIANQPTMFAAPAIDVIDHQKFRFVQKAAGAATAVGRKRRQTLAKFYGLSRSASTLYNHWVCRTARLSFAFLLVVLFSPFWIVGSSITQTSGRLAAVLYSKLQILAALFGYPVCLSTIPTRAMERGFIAKARFIRIGDRTGSSAHRQIITYAIGGVAS